MIRRRVETIRAWQVTRSVVMKPDDPVAVAITMKVRDPSLSFGKVSKAVGMHYSTRATQQAKRFQPCAAWRGIVELFSAKTCTTSLHAGCQLASPLEIWSKVVSWQGFIEFCAFGCNLRRRAQPILTSRVHSGRGAWCRRAIPVCRTLRRLKPCGCEREWVRLLSESFGLDHRKVNVIRYLGSHDIKPYGNPG